MREKCADPFDYKEQEIVLWLRTDNVYRRSKTQSRNHQQLLYLIPVASTEKNTAKYLIYST